MADSGPALEKDEAMKAADTTDATAGGSGSGHDAQDASREPVAVSDAKDEAAAPVAGGVHDTADKQQGGAVGVAAPEATDTQYVSGAAGGAPESDPESEEMDFWDGIDAAIDQQTLKNDRFDFDLSEFNKKANEVPFRKKRDKYLFTLGVLNFGVIAYAAGGHPWFLPIYYSIKFPVLITLRYVLYKQRCWHYFLLDFCYFENLLLLSYIWLFPTSNELFLINFALCNGPLAWAVPAFRNSLVFHSLDKITSAFIHITPVTLTYVIRWHTEVMLYPDTQVCEPDDCPDPWLWSLLAPTLCFAAHQLLYWLIVGPTIPDDPKYLTSFRYLTANPKSAMHKAANCMGRRFAPVVFSLLYTFFAFITCLPAWLFYQYQTVHFLFIVCVTINLVHNGSGFYINVFSRGYGTQARVKAGKGAPPPPRVKRTASVLLS